MLIPALEEDEFMKRVLDSQRAWVERVTYYELMNAPDYTLAYEHYFPGKLDRSDAARPAGQSAGSAGRRCRRRDDDGRAPR